MVNGIETRIHEAGSYAYVITTAGLCFIMSATFTVQALEPNSVHAFQTAERIRQAHPDEGRHVTDGGHLSGQKAIFSVGAR